MGTKLSVKKVAFLLAFTVLFINIFIYYNSRANLLALIADRKLYPNISRKRENTISKWSDILGLKKIHSRISTGERVLIHNDSYEKKILAAEEYDRESYGNAASLFSKTLEKYPNDPEASIYFNNSLAGIDPTPIGIGVSVPIGSNLGVAQEILRGVAQAQDEVNSRGGLLHEGGGRSLVKIVIADDLNNPKIAEEVAREIVSYTDVIGVVGHNSSESSIAAGFIYNEEGLVMVSPTSIATELTLIGKYIFRTTLSSRSLAQTLAEYAIKDKDLDKIAVCIDSRSVASLSFLNEFEDASAKLGGSILKVGCNFSTTKTVLNQAVNKAINRNSEAILLIPAVGSIDSALVVAGINDNRVPLLGNQSLYAESALESNGAAIRDIVLPLTWFPKAGTFSSFNSKSQNIWDKEGSWRTAAAYDATLALFSAAKRSRTREGVQKVLSSSDFAISGASGEIKFTSSGNRKSDNILVTVIANSKSDWGYSFEHVNQSDKMKK